MSARLIGALAALLATAAPSVAHAQSSASDYTSAVRYDDMNRATGTIAPDPDGTGSLAFAATRTTYDAAGRATLVETGELAAWQSESVAPSAWSGFTVTAKVETEYDELDRKTLVTLWRWDATLTTPAWVRTSVSQYSYDPVGRPDCTAMRMNPSTWTSTLPDACTLTSGTGSYGPDRITQNKYDEVGQVTRVIKALGTSLQQDYVTYTYSDNGKVKTVKDANGNVAGYDYDGYDRLVKWSFPSKTTTGSISTDDYESYTYDLNGNRDSFRKRDGRTFTYYYDNLDRVTAKIVPDACVSGYACTAPTSNSTRDVYYGYDARGLQLYAAFNADSGSDRVDNVYDGFGRLSSQTVAMVGVSRTVSFAYNSDGGRRKITWPDTVAIVYAFDGLDRMTTASIGTTALASMAYDAGGREASETRVGVTTTFAYDNAGRLTSLADDLAGGTTNDLTTTYGYSPASQLLSRTRSNTGYAWTGYTNVSRSYVVNGLNQYTTAGSATFGYDSNGNLASDGTSSFTYDAENRLIADNAGNELTYDALGRLYKVANNTSIETYLYAGDQRIAEYDVSGAMTARYVPGPGGDNPLIWYAGSGTTAPQALQGDERGSIVSVADASGAMVAINSYDEYGIPAAGNLGRYGYTGQMWAPQLGLWYYKARFYSPTLGRFLQTDPIGYADQNNVYAYVGNDPMDRSDPTGLFGYTSGGCPAGSHCFTSDMAATSAAYGLGATSSFAGQRGGTEPERGIGDNSRGSLIERMARGSPPRMGPRPLESNEGNGPGVRGGHTLRVHVDKTDAFLRGRLRSDSGLRVTSTFTDLPMARGALNAAVQANAKGIYAWLTFEDSGPSYEIRFTSPIPVGRVMDRNGVARDGYTAVFILTTARPSPGADFGVLTGWVER